MKRKSSNGSGKKVLRLAAIGAIGAWLIRKMRKGAAPEGTWRDHASTPERKPDSD